MIKFVIFVSFVVFANAVPIQVKSNVACDATKIQTCSAAFEKTLGIAEHLTGPELVQFLQKIVLNKGVAGLQEVCGAATALYSCLGPDQASACLTVNSFETIFGLSSLDAAIYTWQFAGLEYSCITKASIFGKNAQCLATVSQTKTSELNQCLSDLLKGTQTDPSNECKYQEAYKNCVVPQYSSCGSEMQSALCEGFAAQAKAVLPTCAVTCSSGFQALNTLISNNADCDATKMKTCSAAFGQTLGITGQQTGPQFVQYLQNLVVTKGTDGLKQICGASAALYSCLGSDQASACLNAGAFQKVFGFGSLDAAIYTWQFAGLEYSCITKATIFGQNAQCLATVSQTKTAALSQCLADLLKGTQTDPANECKYQEAYKNCVVPQYASCGSDMQSTLCQGFSTQAKAVLPTCSFSCSTGSLSLNALAKSNEGCDATKLQTCAVAFNKALGLTGQETGPQLVQFLQNLVVTKGTDGLKQICGAGTQLYMCLGTAQANACLTTDTFKSVFGLDTLDAQIYVWQFAGLEYSCISKAPIFTKNAQCLADVSKSQTSALEQCLSDLFTKTKSDPSNACKYQEAYKDCVVPKYSSCGSEMQSTLCSGFVSQAQSVIPSCSFSCASSLSSLFVRKSCDINKLKQAVASFQDKMGFKLTPDPNTYDRNLEMLWGTQGVKGLDQSCGAVKSLYSILGDDLEDCATVMNLMSTFNLGQIAAQHYLISFGGLHAECTDKYDVYSKNFMCILQQGQAHSKEFEVCQQNFTEEVTKNPFKICTYADEFATCLSKNFVTCGSDVVSAYYYVTLAGINAESAVKCT